MAFAVSDLMGGWTLIDWVITAPDGRETRPFAPAPNGSIMYTPDGLMSATIQASGRAAFPSEDIRKQPAELKAKAFDSYFHYAGTWSVRGDSIVHHVTSAMNPNMIGTEQVRLVTLQGNVLTLSADETLEGGRGVRHHALRWQRHTRL